MYCLIIFAIILFISLIVIVFGLVSVRTGANSYVNYNNIPTGNAVLRMITCNGTVTTLDRNTGDLEIVGSVDLTKDNITCEWIVDGSNPNYTNRFIHLDILENLVLSETDAFIVQTDDGKTVLFETKGFNWPGVILLGDSNAKIRVKLVLSNETVTRKWEVHYAINVNVVQIQNIDSTGRFVFPYLPTDTKTVVKQPFDFNVTLMSKTKINKLLLSLETLDLNGGSVSFDKVEKYTPKDTFDGKIKPDFLLSTERQINIRMSALNVKQFGIQIHYDLVTAECSQYQSIDKTSIDNNMTLNVKFPSNNSIKVLSDYRCLSVFEHQNTNAKLLLDLRTFQFINTGDLITVLDGSTRDSKTLGVIESGFLEKYWKQIYLFSTSNKLWVLFDSPQVINRSINDTNIFGVRSLSQGGSYSFYDTKTNQTQLSLNKNTQPLTPVVFTFTADFDKQIVIDFENSTLPGPSNKNLMEIYEKTGREGTPFIKLNSNEYPPDIMASNTNELKIIFNQILDFKITSIQTVDRGCHSTYLGTNGASYSLSGCNKICSWLIPNKDNPNGTYVLQFSHLFLEKDSDIIMIEMLGPKTSSVLNIKGPINTMTFPDLNLAANQTYVLYTKRNCDKTSIDGSELIGVSLVYVDNDLRLQDLKVNKSQTPLLKTLNYPNYYSIGSDARWKVSGPDNLSALITFTDVDLNPSHQLLLESRDLSLTINRTELSDISDYLVKLPFLMNLTSQTIDASKSAISGRGFEANLTVVDSNCGGRFALNDDNPLTINLTDVKDYTRCFWTVTTDNPNATAIRLLNFTINDGKGFDEKKLRIWDSNTIRDNKFLNYTHFVNVSDKSFSSSTNFLVIEYMITDPKKDSGLKMTFKRTVCESKCIHTNRCSLPQFLCNGVNDCGDWSDERCNGTNPLPPVPTPTPAPEPIVYHSGVNGWVVTLVICPLMIGFGVLGTLFGPRLLTRFGRGRYSEFQDLSEVS